MWIKTDPGSRTTGLVLVRESQEVGADTGEVQRSAHVLCLTELVHRGHAIRAALRPRAAFRRRRRCANLRHRQAGFDNRTRRNGWLPPSLQHRGDTIMSWVRRLCRWAPVWSLPQELVSRVMKDKAFDPFLRRSSGSRKVAGHVVLTGQPGFPVDVLWNALLKALSQTSILAMVW